MKVLVVGYSMYGHMNHLARPVPEGAAAVGAVDVKIRRVADVAVKLRG